MSESGNRFNYVAVFWVLFWLGLIGYLLYTSDYVQSRINLEAWVIEKEQKRSKSAEKKVAFDTSMNIAKEKQNRLKELDQIECKYMLKVERDLFPVGIERLTLGGMTPVNAEKNVLLDYELDVLFCEKFGISPYTKTDAEK